MDDNDKYRLSFRKNPSGLALNTVSVSALCGNCLGIVPKLEELADHRASNEPEARVPPYPVGQLISSLNTTIENLSRHQCPLCQLFAAVAQTSFHPATIKDGNLNCHLRTLQRLTTDESSPDSVFL
jgi:hypothetical protein